MKKRTSKKLEGEGSYSATRGYNAGLAEHMRTAAVWCEDSLQRQDCVNACRALRDLDGSELEQLAQVLSQSLEQNDAELHLSQAGRAERLLRRLDDCDPARALGSEFVLKRRRAELLRDILMGSG